MDNIEKFVKEVGDFISTQENINEERIIRYVYLSLGDRFKFNPEYSPFGSDKQKDIIYKEGFKYNNLNKAFDTGLIVCNSLSRILTIILRRFDIDAECRCEVDTITGCDNPFLDEMRRLHMYNVINLKDGRVISVDLQEDIPFIKMRAMTPNYGLAEDRKKRVISLEEIKQDDIALGYISNEKFYVDDYYKKLFYYADEKDSNYEQAKYILENINPDKEKNNVGYCERLMFHVHVLESYFGKTIINFNRESGSIKVLNLYRFINGEKRYLNAFTQREGNKVHVFLYNQKESCYKEIDYDRFMNAIINGVEIHRCKVPSLEKDYQRIRKK